MSPTKTDLPAWDTRMTLLVHAALLRDFTMIRDAALEPPTEALRARWRLASDILRHHQQAEDQRLWPLLETADCASQAAEVLRAMREEHSGIDPLVAAVDESLSAEGQADPVVVRARLDILITALREHFAHEERVAMPLLADVVPIIRRREFERAQRDSIDPEQRLMFFPWLADQADSADVEFVWTKVPWFVRRLVKGKGERQYRELTVAAFGEGLNCSTLEAY